MGTITAITVMTEAVLFHSNGPDLILARDEFGTAYLCLLFKLDETGHQYLATKITSARLSDLKGGKIDLREAFTRPEQDQYFRGLIPPGERTAVSLEVWDQNVPEEWLPQPGFLLSEFADDIADDSDLVRVANESNAAVIVCRVNPIEARGLESRIDADRLASAIRKFQFLVRQSAKTASGNRTAKKNSAEDGAGLHVVAFAPGSFVVHFESKDRANLFGESLVGAAMERIDALMDIASKPIEELPQALEPHRGAVMAAYHDLLRFLHKNDLPFAYQWSQPALNHSKSRKLSVDTAGAIAAVIETEKTLTTETVAFKGRFTSVQTDRQPFSWTARDAEDGKHFGQLHEAHQDVLTGVTIKATEYVFDCEQRLVTTPAGDPAQKLFLRAVQPQT
jgi:hypothetical protein